MAFRRVTKTRLLGMTVDHKLTRTSHVMDIKSFVTKLYLLKRSRFLPRKVLRDIYFNVILPSAKYGLVLWGACCDSYLFHSIQNDYTVGRLESSLIYPKIRRHVTRSDAADQWPTLSL